MRTSLDSGLEKGGVLTVRKDGKEFGVQRNGEENHRKELPAAPYTVVGIQTDRMKDKLTDDDVPLLAKLTDLEHLILQGDKITLDGLARLASACKIKSLTFRNTPIAAAGKKALPVIEKLTWLEYFKIPDGPTEVDAEVTDAFAETLAKLPNLKWVEVLDVKMSENGLVWLARAQKLERLCACKNPRARRKRPRGVGRQQKSAMAGRGLQTRAPPPPFARSRRW